MRRVFGRAVGRAVVACGAGRRTDARTSGMTSAEGERELTGRGRREPAAARRCSRPEGRVAEHAGDVGGARCDLQEAHAPLAAFDGTYGDVDGEDALEQPGPGVARLGRRPRVERPGLAWLKQGELHLGPRRRAARDDALACCRAGGEHAVLNDILHTDRDTS